jgi:hypothetical protein
MQATVAPARKRRPHNELKSAVRGYLEKLDGRTASIPQIRAATAQALGFPPQSSYRSALQDERYFLRVSRGVFRLVDESADVD